MNLPPPPVDPRASLQARLATWLNPWKPPPGWAGIPAQCLGFFVRIPATAYLAFAIFAALAAIVLVAWIRFHQAEHRAWDFEFGWVLLAGALLIAVVVPFLFLRTIALWREPIASEYELLDRSWRAGTTALAREGIDITAVPLFLLLGSLPSLRERSLLESADRGVKLVGPDDGPFIWYAGREVLYLSFRDIGVTGELTTTVGRSIDDDHAEGETTVRDLQTAKRQHRSLVYVCRRLGRQRLPVCALNGVLVVAGFSRVLNDEALDRTAAGIRSDLLTIQRETGTRAPVTLLIDGLEAVPGFDELVRRLGRERTTLQRFGHRFELAAAAHRDDLVRLTDHVCGAFEEWVHILFREQRVLERAGNGRLYALVSRVRLQLAERLGRLLSGGFGFDPAYEDEAESIAFSGCYVSGTSGLNDRWSFARGVLDKQQHEQELVEWTPRLRRRLGWRRTGWRVALGLNLLLFVTLVTMLAVRYTGLGRILGTTI